MMGKKRDLVSDYAPASIASLDGWYRRHGAETPPREICTPVRWRIYLAAKRNPRRFRCALCADMCSQLSIPCGGIRSWEVKWK